MMIIVDYGLGNMSAFTNLYKRINIDCHVARSAADLERASKIILPGVGAFDHAIELLNASGMRGTLERRVREDQIPVLGICVGMQILADGSDEGSLPGLGWIPGRVMAFRSCPKTAGLPLPHMGWNDVRPRAGNPLFQGIEQNSRFYFLHSFYFECAHRQHVAATSEYGMDFSCAVQAGNVHGVQFHPEKSHRYGAGLLKNFAEL
jgi:imidazole glycerol-phosphate synthase subunit HisH